MNDNASLLGTIALDDSGRAWSHCWGVWFRLPLFDLKVTK